jgi:TonB family protein
MIYSHSLTLPWSISAEDEQRFRRILTIAMLMTIALGIAIPLAPVFKKPVEEIVVPPRVAKLLFEKRTEPKKPKPKPIEKKKPEPKPVEKKKPEPVPEPIVKKKPIPKKRPKPPPKVVKKPVPKKPVVNTTELARKKAKTTGLLAMSDSLADLRDQSSVNKLRGAKRLNNGGATAKQTSRSLITSKIAGASGGINTAKLSRSTGSTQLSSRTATEVSSPVTPVATKKKAKGKGSNLQASRSIEEIQIVFDKNKSTIYNLYYRELRKDPSLQGKLVLRLTIAPSGRVTGIELVSSELSLPSLEQKLLQRVKMFSFGAKSVDTITITYPIDFLPA